MANDTSKKWLFSNCTEIKVEDCSQHAWEIKTDNNTLINGLELNVNCGEFGKLIENQYGLWFNLNSKLYVVFKYRNLQ